MATPAAETPAGTNTNLGVGSSIYSGGGGGGGGGGFGGGGMALAPAMSAGFRVAELILALLTWILLASSDSRGQNFTPFYAFTFLLSIAVIYTAWLLVLLLVDLIKMFGSGEMSATMLTIQSVGEFIMMMLMFAAACSAACEITQLGNGNVGINGGFVNYCSYFDSFCSIVSAAVAMAFLCSFVQIAHYWFLTRSMFAAM